MIIVYMLDEKAGTPVAQQMVEKGYENCYILSGGIEKFLEECTDLVEGTDVPVPQKTILAEKEQMRKTKQSICS